jgi:two-component system, OmpR family, phosphate regulon response regulator PhoB
MAYREHLLENYYPAPASVSELTMAQPRVLVIEGDRVLTKSLTDEMTQEGYEVMVAGDGPEGLRKAQALLPDLILLEVELNGMDGLAVCKELRVGERTRDVPIVIMTSKAEEMDLVLGYSSGADLYVTKPFSIKVLIHKVKALLRRRDGTVKQSERVEHLGLRIDRIKHRVTLRSKAVDVTPTEFRLIETLVRQPGRAFNRRQLMDSAIGDGQIVLERTIDVHIKTLRKKLEACGATVELIETVRGVGYRFREGR